MLMEQSWLQFRVDLSLCDTTLQITSNVKLQWVIFGFIVPKLPTNNMLYVYRPGNVVHLTLKRILILGTIVIPTSPLQALTMDKQQSIVHLCMDVCLLRLNGKKQLVDQKAIYFLGVMKQQIVVYLITNRSEERRVGKECRSGW